MGDGTEESHKRMLAAIPEVWRFTVELIAFDASEQRLCEAGITPDIASVAAQWQVRVEQIFTGATLPVPAAPNYFYLNARKGLHTEHLGILLAEMQFLPRAYPDATW
ncbi:1,2-phenylacetyl-CoA epoxidase, subunit C [compost metagenome]